MKIKTSIIICTVIVNSILFYSCGGVSNTTTLNESSTSQSISSLKVVTIGKQVWMTENLKVNTFKNGDSITEAKTDEEWKKASENQQPAWCYYNNDPNNGEKYGKLYNWYAVNDPRGLAPQGYHIPTDAEWSILSNYLGATSGGKIKSTSGWNENANGSNESGFNAFPGGCRVAINALAPNGFANMGDECDWWSSTENDKEFAWFYNLNNTDGSLFRSFTNKSIGYSIRCLRD